MKNPFVIYDSKTGAKSIRKWPVYTLFGLLFLLSLLLIYSLPSGVEVKLEDALPRLPKAADGAHFSSKMELYSALRNEPSSTFSSRLAYLFSENADSSLISVGDSSSLVDDEYPNSEEKFIEDDSWTRSHKAQLELRTSLEELAFPGEDSSPIGKEEETVLSQTGEEEISALKSLLRQREADLEKLISSLEQRQNFTKNASSSVNISDNSVTDGESAPLKTASLHTSVKAVSNSSGVVSGLGLPLMEEESGLPIPVQTPSSQRIYVGELLEMRLMSDVSLWDGTVLEKNTRLFASTSLQGDRLLALVESVAKDGRLIPLGLEAYSTRDGLKGVEIDNALKDNAVSDFTDRLANTTSSSAIRLISNASSALGSVAEDGLRSVIQGGASYLSRKAQRKRVVIPSHLELFLK